MKDGRVVGKFVCLCLCVIMLVSFVLPASRVSAANKYKWTDKITLTGTHHLNRDAARGDGPYAGGYGVFIYCRDLFPEVTVKNETGMIYNYAQGYTVGKQRIIQRNSSWNVKYTRVGETNKIPLQRGWNLLIFCGCIDGQKLKEGDKIQCTLTADSKSMIFVYQTVKNKEASAGNACLPYPGENRCPFDMPRKVWKEFRKFEKVYTSDCERRLAGWDIDPYVYTRLDELCDVIARADYETSRYLSKLEPKRRDIRYDLIENTIKIQEKAEKNGEKINVYEAFVRCVYKKYPIDELIKTYEESLPDDKYKEPSLYGCYSGYNKAMKYYLKKAGREL